MKKESIKTLAVAGMLAILGIGAVAVPAWADDDLNLNVGVKSTLVPGMEENPDLGSIVNKVVNIFLWAVGIVAVIIMIFGGFQYITSSGDQAKVTKAKNTILYGIVGLVIAILAYAIVGFVTNQFSSSN